MGNLAINLLGTPTIIINREPLQAQTYKATALLAYLAINQGLHTRLELGTLLWTELPKEKALAALRTTLWKLKRAGLKDWLQIQRGAVFLNLEDVTVDVLEFQKFIAQCETHFHHPSKVCPACLAPLAEAANLYHGDFMKGFSLRDAGDFDNWQAFYGEILRRNFRQVLEKLVKGHRAQGELESAIHYARRWTAHDRTNEEIHRLLMSLYVDAGRRTEAIQQYHELTKLLRREGLEPQPESTQLYDHILKQKTERVFPYQELEKPIILATDIENSETMWENYHEQMMRTVARYQAIIKESANHYGGTVVKQTGDTSLIFFDKGQPLHCVLAIHKRLMRTTWTVNTIPRIRIALNAVEQEQADLDDYLADFYRTQRLLSAGWGGQALLTSQVLNMVELPPEAQAHDLGIHMLKDLGEPLRIYQLAHHDLPSREFPPLQSLSNYHQNLPSYPTLFIGRESEQAEIAELLLNDKCRLLTLSGPGGVGKTRLALQVAAKQTDMFPDGVYFVPVIVPKTPDLIPVILAETFKIAFYEQKNPLELITDFLRKKQILLIIDNLEHLTEGADMLLYLINHAPGLKMIITSRERLNLHEEWVYDVQGMPYPTEQIDHERADEYSAVKLFIQNARRILPGFIPSKEELNGIINICKIVDGIPLAIELATAWIRTLSCQEIAKEIQLNIDFLSTTARDVPPRHRSLRAVFEHSWNLLSEEDRRTFRKLSIFRGGFTTDAAFQVTRATPAMLASFVDRSLLKRMPQDHFEIMETIRHFAVQKLLDDKAQYENIRTQHCNYYAGLLAQNVNLLMNANHRQGIEEIRREFENIHACWEWAVENGNWAIVASSAKPLMIYSELVGQYGETRNMFFLALEKLEATPVTEFTGLKATIQVGIGWMLFYIGEHANGVQYLQRGLDGFTQMDATVEAAVTLALLAKANERLNHHRIATEQAKQSLAILQDEHNANDQVVRSAMAFALEVLGRGYFQSDQISEAKKCLQESMRINQELNHPYGIVQVAETLSRVLSVEGDPAGVLPLHLQALKIARDFDNKYSIAILLTNLADTYMNLDDRDNAIRAQQESLDMSREIGYRWLSAIGLNNLAFMFSKFYSDHAEAIRLYSQSLSLFHEIEDQHGEIYTLHDMGITSLKAGQLDRSREYFIEALTKANQIGSQKMQLYILSGLAGIYARNRQPAYANDLCQLVLLHPDSNADSKRHASEVLKEINLEIAKEQPQTQQPQDHTADLKRIVSDLLTTA